MSQGNGAMQRAYKHTRWLFDCYLHSLHKSRCECETTNQWQNDTSCYLPYPQSSCNFGIIPWEYRSIMFGSAKNEHSPLYYFRCIPTYVTTSTSQTDRQTDGQLAVAIPRVLAATSVKHAIHVHVLIALMFVSHGVHVFLRIGSISKSLYLMGVGNGRYKDITGLHSRNYVLLRYVTIRYHTIPYHKRMDWKVKCGQIYLAHVIRNKKM